MKSITFKIADPNAGADERSIARPSPYISFVNPENDLRDLQDADDIVINGDAKVRFDYPFSRSEDLTLCHPSGHFTRANIARAVAEMYQQIYREEEETSTIPGETYADQAKRQGRTGVLFLNRIETDGNWGIWGHVLGHLVLHTIEWDPNDEVWRLGIDS